MTLPTRLAPSISQTSPQYRSRGGAMQLHGG
jgi:hypothetical protein